MRKEVRRYLIIDVCKRLDGIEWNIFTFASMAEKDLYAPCKFEIEL